MSKTHELVKRWLAWFAAHDEKVTASLAPSGGPLATVAPNMDCAVAWYASHDGQPTDGDLPPPVYERYRWMSIAEIAATREDLDGMANVGEWDTDKYKRIDWWVPGWVPLLTDNDSNYLCIDTVGSFGGAPGQLLEFIHDDETRGVLAPSFDAWFAAWTESLEAGAWKHEPGEGFEHTPSVIKGFAATMPGYPRTHASTKQKIAAPKQQPAKKQPKKDDPLLAVYKSRMSASEIAAALAAGASVHARDAQGATPLHLAMSCGNELPAQALIAAGADVDATNQRGETPLHLAALAHQRTTATLIAMLVNAGADVNRCNAEGQPPLAYASSIEAMTALLDRDADTTITFGGQTIAQHHRYMGRSPAMLELLASRS